MTWKPVLLAAVVEMIAGAADGVAIGGKEKTKVETVAAKSTTVTKTETVTASSPDVSEPTPTDTTGPSTDPDPTNPTTKTQNPQKQYLSTMTDDIISDHLGFETGPVTLGKNTYDDSTTVDDVDPCCEYIDEFEISTDTLPTFKADAIGFDPQETDSKMSTSLTIYSDDDHGTVLYGPRRFHGSDKPVPLNVDLKGANKLVFVFKRLDSHVDTTDIDNMFVFGNARLVP